MRVLYLSELFWPYVGGTEVFGAELLAALRERGHELAVVTSHDTFALPDRDEYAGIPIHRHRFREALGARDFDGLARAKRHMARLKREFRPDLIHMNSIGTSALLHVWTAGVHPAPLLLSMNTEISADMGAGRDTLTWTMLRAADRVACVSESVLGQARQLVPEIASRASVVYWGSRTPDRPPRPLPGGEAHLVCLGRLIALKGFDVALAAVARIAGRYPHIRLTVAGDGEMRPELERQAAELGLGRATRFAGWVVQEEKQALLESASMVLIPSRSEGLPIVAIEAALSGRPVVATRIAGLPEIVVHGETGLLVPKEDSRALADAIAFLLDNPDSAVAMGREARCRAREMFDWERCVSAYDTLYRDLARKAAARGLEDG